MAGQKNQVKTSLIIGLWLKFIVNKFNGLWAELGIKGKNIRQ